MDACYSVRFCFWPILDAGVQLAFFCCGKATEMAGNANLHKANKAKQDEFYTQLADIENELKHYRDFFKDKVVFCNCDDPFESNFFKYFAMNFNFLGLKKLICTCYAGSPVAYTELDDLPLFKKQKTEKMPYMIEINEVKDLNGDGTEDMTDIEMLLRNDNNTLTILDGDGDFRSEESIGFLQEADVIVTNPPFSLFREFITQLFEYNKNFLILGNMNAITYKEVFPLIKKNKMWTGYKHFGGGMNMIMPGSIFDKNKIKKYEINHKGEIITNIMGVIWFTNIDTEKRHEDLILYKKYTPEEYPKYDNYDAINVDKAVEIPYDYDGVMGVPITFLDKYNPDQFEIIALGNSRDNFTPTKDYIEPIKHLKDGATMNGGAINCVLAINESIEPKGKIYYTAKNANYLVPPYARILIKRRVKNEN